MCFRRFMVPKMTQSSLINFKNTMPSGSSPQQALYWVNSLPITSAMLVDDICDLSSPQGASTLVDIILHVVNGDTSENGGSKATLTKKSTPGDHLRAAVRLLGQRVGWGNLAPALFERETADYICAGDQSLLLDLLDDLRTVATATTSTPNTTTASSKEERGTSRRKGGKSSSQQLGQRVSLSRGDTKESSPLPPRAPSTSSIRTFATPSSSSSDNDRTRRRRTKQSKSTTNENISNNGRNRRGAASGSNAGPPGIVPPPPRRQDLVAASASDGLAGLSNDDLEEARNRVAKMLQEATTSLEMEEEKSKRGGGGGGRGGGGKRRGHGTMKQQPHFSTRPWAPPQNGWNQSTETLAGTKDKSSTTSTSATSSSSSVGVVTARHVHLVSSDIQRSQRDRGGRHRPAATSFHNREFQNGSQRVDKDGLVTDGMWDPTFTPSLRRLSELGFSPTKARKSKSGTLRGGMSGGDRGGVYYYHDAVNAPSNNSGHAGSSRGGGGGSDTSMEEEVGNGASYRISKRVSTGSGNGMQQWKKELRTPSKKRGGGRRRGGRSAAAASEEEEEEEMEVSGRRSVFKAPHDASRALSEKQIRIVHWMKQLGIRPCPNKKEKELTGGFVSAAFADGVLLCSLVANLEVRAGGRSANVTPGAEGKLTLEGTNFKPRTTASCTGNLNNALKVLRHRKQMNTRHLWSANDLRNGDETIVWELLCDIEQEYSANRIVHQKRSAASKKTQEKKKTKKKKKKKNQQVMATAAATPKRGSGGGGGGGGGVSFMSGPASNPASTLRSKRMSLSAHLSNQQQGAFTSTSRKPFGLLDPELREEEEEEELSSSLKKGGASTQRRRRRRQRNNTDR